MEYERIEKPFSSSSSLQVGGFSPRKLRSMLGMEKKRKEEEEEEEVFKDVKVVSSGPEPHHNAATSMIRSLDGDVGAAALSAFEFHKATAATAAQRPSFSKPAPSKWDDAHKWLASSNSNQRTTKEKRAGGGGGGGHRSRTSAMKTVVEDVDTKRVDPSQIKREIGEHKEITAAATNSVKDSCLMSAKPVIGVENLATDSAGLSKKRSKSKHGKIIRKQKRKLN